MKIKATGLKEYGNAKVGRLKEVQVGKRTRWVRCIGIVLGDDRQYYAHWQYVLANTFKPSGKSTSFFEVIILPIKITLSDVNGAVFIQDATLDAANNKAKFVIRQKKYSDLYYQLHINNDEITGQIDLEPFDFHAPHIDRIITNHFQTFWGNISKVAIPNPHRITQEDKEYFAGLLETLNAHLTNN